MMPAHTVIAVSASAQVYEVVNWDGRNSIVLVEPQPDGDDRTVLFPKALLDED